MSTFIDEMFELFGGIDAEYILSKIPYKEAIAMRDTRIKRRTKELKEEEEERKKELQAQQRAMARDKILR